jgi:hypothetical protein
MSAAEVVVVGAALASVVYIVGSVILDAVYSRRDVARGRVRGAARLTEESK